MPIQAAASSHAVHQNEQFNAKKRLSEGASNGTGIQEQ